MEPITPENASPGMIATLTSVAALQGHNDIDQVLKLMQDKPELGAMVRQQAMDMDRMIEEDPELAAFREERFNLLQQSLPKANDTTAGRREERLSRENRRTARWSINLLTYVVRKALFEPNWRDPRYNTYVGLASVG